MEDMKQQYQDAMNNRGEFEKKMEEDPEGLMDEVLTKEEFEEEAEEADELLKRI